MARTQQIHAGEGTHPPTTRPDWPRLGSRIRTAREKLAIPLADLVSRAHVGEFTLRQVEAGEEDPGLRVIEILDSEFGAEGVLVDAWAQVYISHHVRAGSRVDQLHREAGQIRAFAPLVIPEHFQTESYTRALDRAERPLEPNYLVRDRPRLPRLMAGGSGPPFHCLVLDEAALHRTVESAETTRDQLAHLRRLARASYITVHVIPSGTPHHPGLRGAFWTLSFSPRHALAYTPHPRGPGHLVTDATHIKGYVDLFATLQGAALPADASLRLLDRTIDQTAQTRPAITTGNTATTADAAAPYAFDTAARAAAD
ncbi:transcriptional regulator with XRE-family HTH domain [Lipingzhangella halophila]|uniref:Transcriptional regulator with XRE-family HTH domain n=1 Tax=Lipingzhangella halophila TaxID=1783352 RepID=A0A7W7REM0_9ACTN|nr:Scr1 family TA system antitoxin-like transcriptional regulator [Lipingzhangella halophila]MBB4930011.1 transcriptional regulator with XRE-family HTH domain [Lipingzhangella halophila]